MKSHHEDILQSFTSLMHELINNARPQTSEDKLLNNCMARLVEARHWFEDFAEMDEKDNPDDN